MILNMMKKKLLSNSGAIFPLPKMLALSLAIKKKINSFKTT